MYIARAQGLPIIHADQPYTVTLVSTGLSEILMHLFNVHSAENPHATLIICMLIEFNLIYPTPGCMVYLTHALYKEQMWSDKQLHKGCNYA